MMFRPSVLCPIDFSESSRGALRYAAAVAAHGAAQLTVLAVNDPLLEEADELAGTAHLAEDTRRDVERFLADTFELQPHGVPEVRVDVAIGKPAEAILRVAGELHCQLIVMSSHGSTGLRKLFFGSTTERVLRETHAPVLVTPGLDASPVLAQDVPAAVRRVLVPVDLTAATQHQLRIARGLSEAVGVPLLLLHVVEPVRATASAATRLPKVEPERRYRAERDLEQLLDGLPASLRAEALVAYGEPAEEIAKVAQDRDAGIIVIGLHSSPLLGPRMGSVTYRVMRLAHRPILALPPLPMAGKEAAPRKSRRTRCQAPIHA
jgi:nucleotide-binding universal stress UspA family protein